MAPKMCVLVALNVVVLFALVSGCEKCPPVKNTSSGNTTATVTVSTSGCPRDVLKLGVCSGVLNGWFNFTTGLPPKTHCCSVIEGLADDEVAVCICTALKANIIGFNLSIPNSFTKLINTCDKNVPHGFVCA